MTTMQERPQPICRAIVGNEDLGCGKRPDELMEYRVEAKVWGITPDQYVEREEGTFNAVNGHFLCTVCYMRAGQPSSRQGWVAP